MEYLQLKIELSLGTAFHTTGNRHHWGADKALAMSADELFIIPATTVKGFIRRQAERLLRSWGKDVCTGPEPTKMCYGQNLCLICQLFGNPRYPSPLRFQDATLQIPDQTASTIRSSVAISRYRRATYPQRLFFTETTEAASTRWSLVVEGFFHDVVTAQAAASLVAMAITWGPAIGGGHSRGLGWVEHSQVQATLNGEIISQETLTRFWQSWKGGESVAED